MKRILFSTPFLLSALIAQAQQPDTLVGLTNEGLSTRTVEVTTFVEQFNLPAFTSAQPVINRILELKTPAFTTIQPALTRAAGVQVTPYSGAPGAWATIRIRGGNNLTANSQPLYVVDGVPVYNTDVTPERWTSLGKRVEVNPLLSTAPNQPTPHSPTANPLLDLPVEDVDYITVLTGAAGTALYGMQGSNGVILITTKRGADGRTTPQPLRVRYSGWGGVQQVRQRYDLLSGRQYADMLNAWSAADDRNPLYSADDLRNLREVDWQDELFRPAAMQSHNLSLDGLAHKTRYYVSADYLNQAGVIVKSGMSRAHLRLNLDQQLTDKLNVGLRVSGSQTDQHYPGTQLDAGMLVQSYLQGIPTTPARIGYGQPFNDATRSYLEENRQTARTRRLLTQFTASYQFSPSLRLSAIASREQAEAEELTHFQVPPYFNPVPTSETKKNTTSNRNWVVSGTLSYQHVFAERHDLTATLNYLRQQDQQKGELHHFFNFEQKRLAIQSPSAVLGYTYAGRYSVQASMRSEFATGHDVEHKQYWFPGLGLAWHLHKEAFLADVPGLTDLTLFAGTGKTSSFFSSDRTTQHEIGLRTGLLNGHLTFTASAYQRRTTDAQVQLPVVVVIDPIYTPSDNQPNVTLLNRGLELTAVSVWQLGPVASISQLTAATNRNEVEAVRSKQELLTFLILGLEAGQPMSRFFVFDQDGTYPAGVQGAGQRRFRDRNNNGSIGYTDGYYSGQGLPRYSLSLTQQLRYKRLQLDAQLDGLFGYQILNSSLLRLDSPSGSMNNTTRVLNYWTHTNQNTNVPHSHTSPNPGMVSAESLESGNHLRLSQLTLSFEVVNTATRKASVWIGGQNLFVTGPYRGFDPNVSSAGAAAAYAGQDVGAYPVARVWQLGLRGQF